MEIKKIMVLGAGTMGAGIAQVAAQSGYQVVLRDIADEYVDRGIKTITKNLSKLVEKGKLSDEAKEAALARITGTVDLLQGQDADVVIEAVVENMEIKKQVYKELSSIIKEGAIFATNTSALSVTEIAVATNRPDKVIGMHFFNPVPVMKLVELIRGVTTSDETYDAIKGMVEKMGKTGVQVNEAPGFVVNRILIPMINEAAYALMEGVASAKDIDEAMKLGANHPIGPLALGDLIGLDVCLAIMETLQREFGEAKYRPCPLMRKMVRAGQLGRKTGKGFFDYSK
jgi:3-hydroxybutyryl-CoA dehydrogenase